MTFCSAADGVLAVLFKYLGEAPNTILCSAFFQTYSNIHKHGLSCNLSTVMKSKITMMSSRGLWVRRFLVCFLLDI
jgi:hypothetical protein